jgi:nucleolar protein 58
MGIEISESDLAHPRALRSGYIDVKVPCTTFRVFLCNLMITAAPNLTVLVGELVGARLISCGVFTEPGEASSEYSTDPWRRKGAIFRALKTKHDTPTYELYTTPPLSAEHHPS